jgi:NAD(P)-dependent dehydrogenase (short-subunit alcohol dehydrogenase family)
MAVRALIVGGRGGIGTGFRELLLRSPANAVLSTSRDAWWATQQQSERHHTFQMDATKESDFEGLASKLKDMKFHPNVVIVATGILKPRDDASVRPETSIKKISPDLIWQNVEKNVLPTALALKLIMADKDVVPPSQDVGVFAALSAKVGSISDNETGGWLSYRMSKAAVNQLIKSATSDQEFARKRPGWKFLAVHPGTVQTELSDPYYGKKGDKLISDVSVQLDPAAYNYMTKEVACRAMWQNLLERALASDPGIRNGRLYDYCGQEIPP